MIRKQAGQALVLVLIVLAIGAMLVVPSLRLTGTALTGTPIVERQVKGLYAADAAQEYVLWKLLYDLEWRTTTFPDDGATIDLNFGVCGVPVDCTVIMRATPAEGGMVLATDDKIRPTKTVTPDYVPGKQWETYTYTIEMEQLSMDTSVGLDAIYDVLPNGLSNDGYIAGSSEMSLDGGNTWLSVPDPYIDPTRNTYLKWPADYNWDPVVVNPFTSDGSDGFYGMRDFDVRQVKLLRFEILGRLNDDATHCNWVVLKMDDGTNTVSGPQAPITVGAGGDNPGECFGDQIIDVYKTSDPEIIQPGVVQYITYTVYLTNQYTQTRTLEGIVDYLPPGFTFDEDVDVSGFTTIDPIVQLVTVNGIERQELTWTAPQFPGGIDYSIASEETVTLVFGAVTTKDVSGSYYNEILAFLKNSGITNSGFTAAGITAAEYGTNYSWNTGTVIVPAYDTSSESEGVTINTNMALILGGITITSWQVY